MTSLAIHTIRRDGGLQIRETIDVSAVNEYTQRFRDGGTFPPVVVFYDGTTYWLADGYHRVEGASVAGLKEIAADVRTGTKRDALLFACGANDDHGLRRTNADKRRAVETVLRDVEWGAKSEEWIASTCRVSRKLVTAVREELNLGKNKLVEGRDGKIRDVSNIGKAKAAEVTPTVSRETEEVWDEPEDDGEVEVLDAPEPPPVKKEVDLSRVGSIETTHLVLKTIELSRATASEMDRLFDAVHPSDREDFASRVQDPILNLFERLYARLPVTAKRVEFNRSQFKVVK